ncbi:hypothetical protein Cgig2_010189 [Carnegiea gigantea]|uniref:FAS1 domain-containing protein n=1 Tax=Carnegiea gigantea TaxID=171969 RepID=A0A9Q1QEZ5_9CARY|nr:hypothetical protein Cgig2_010189 [Carnegiea gigantea]
MASKLQVFFLVLAAIATQSLAQSPAAPAPSPPGPVNLTAILEKGGQFTTFIRLLYSTQAVNQIANQLNSSRDGLTVFAPTDNAFQNLKTGTINDLTQQQQVELVQYHILPKFYTLANFQTISNPVRTQAGDFVLTITYVANNQVNVSTGMVETPINNPLRQESPLAVYQLDKIFGPKAPASSPASSGKSDGVSSAPKAEAPAVDDAGKNINGGYGVRSMGMAFVFGVALVTMGFLS